MKKSLALLLALVMLLGILAGCAASSTTEPADSSAETTAPAETVQTEEPAAESTETLKVAFVPSREPQEIITATEPLKELLKTELAKEGYDVGEVEITVGTTYVQSAKASRPVRSTLASFPAARTSCMTTARRSS